MVQFHFNEFIPSHHNQQIKNRLLIVKNGVPFEKFPGEISHRHRLSNFQNTNSRHYGRLSGPLTHIF